MKIHVSAKQRSYDVCIAAGSINAIEKYAGQLNRVFVVTDSGVPFQWISKITDQFPQASLFVMPQGEANKNMDSYSAILNKMIEAGLNRNDTVIAVGGGVVGDVAGFAAATYMRGIRFINVPTTILAQIDSSVGGKTAIDVGEFKNIVGSFWQPSCVIIDTDTLSTLPQRHLSNGLAEAVKMGLIRDKLLFELFENEDYKEHLQEIISRSVQLKKEVVEQDEYEAGLRKILNFGHTIGHAYESYYGFEKYLHGECVAMGMMKILEDESIRMRLEKVLNKLHLPLSCTADPDKLVELIRKDKKAGPDDTISVVQVNTIGKAEITSWSLDTLARRLAE